MYARLNDSPVVLSGGAGYMNCASYEACGCMTVGYVDRSANHIPLIHTYVGTGSEYVNSLRFRLGKGQSPTMNALNPLSRSEIIAQPTLVK